MEHFPWRMAFVMENPVGVFHKDNFLPPATRALMVGGGGEGSWR